jgi:hypothetical protein
VKGGAEATIPASPEKVQRLVRSPDSRPINEALEYVIVSLHSPQRVIEFEGSLMPLLHAAHAAKE